ncbi:prolyl oligopeptidase family serine peptidase [Mucilaginibacter yixingensis]|nr:prolyl oligopeptidase family serine peptidase [Mucilaginibacter yixingensis]
MIVLQACKDKQVSEIPVRNFFKIPDKSSFKISPDGKYISYLKPYKDQQNIFIQSLTDGTEKRITSYTDFAVRDYVWTFDNQIVYYQNADKKATNPGDRPIDQFRMYAFDLGTMKNRVLLTQEKIRIKILGRAKQQPDILSVVMNKRDSTNFDVYKLNIQTGELKPYVINPGNITEWYSDPDGRIHLAKSSDGVNESILYRHTESAPFKTIIKNNFKNSVVPIAFTGEGNLFYALSNVDRDKTALVEINAETGKEEKVDYASDKADISDYSYSRNKRRMESISWVDAKQQTYFLNAATKAIYDDVSAKLHGIKIKITDRDSAERKFIIYTYADRDPGSYYLYEKDGKKLTKIGDLNSSLKHDLLCEIKPISFKASDGMQINGYLTLPQTQKQTNLPVVVLVHNGPWRRDGWGYNSELQFLANRGYAVFQVNYRGSTGYGKAYYSAGFKQVGGKMQQDIADGVKWLIAQKIANPKKVAIMGSGFGGFSALYGVSTHPELYSCAVVQSGLINFFTYIKDVPPYFKSSVRMMYEMVGNPETDADQLRNISPVFHTDKFKAPLLIFQGGRDPRANVSELTQFVSELKRRKVPVTYIYKKDERQSWGGHNRMEMYAEIERFLDTNMRVKP